MIPMAIGTALALVALTFVLFPLFREAGLRPLPPGAGAAAPVTRASAVDALREIEFDHATGKLSEGDYAALKATYTQRAVSAMRANNSAAGGEMRVCPVCGPRPESDARFCSECGSQL